MFYDSKVPSRTFDQVAESFQREQSGPWACTVHASLSAWTRGGRGARSKKECLVLGCLAQDALPHVGSYRVRPPPVLCPSVCRLWDSRLLLCGFSWSSPRGQPRDLVSPSVKFPKQNGAFSCIPTAQAVWGWCQAVPLSGRQTPVIVDLFVPFGLPCPPDGTVLTSSGAGGLAPHHGPCPVCAVWLRSDTSH